MKFIIYKSLCCFFIFLFYHVNGYTQFIKLQGTVLNRNNQPLKDCNVKVSRKASSLLVAYANTSEVTILLLQ